MLFSSIISSFFSNQIIIFHHGSGSACPVLQQVWKVCQMLEFGTIWVWGRCRLTFCRFCWILGKGRLARDDLGMHGQGWPNRRPSGGVGWVSQILGRDGTIVYCDVDVKCPPPYRNPLVQCNSNVPQCEILNNNPPEDVRRCPRPS